MIMIIMFLRHFVVFVGSKLVKQSQQYVTIIFVFLLGKTEIVAFLSGLESDCSDVA